MLPQPADKPFVYNRGGYQTLNFLPSLVTMLFGLMCGELLRSNRGQWVKLGWMLLAGSAAIGFGWLLDYAGICPLVKRIWTPSWAIFSTGWCLLILAGLYLVIDCFGWQRWSFPLLVVGMNSIAIYAMSMLFKDIVVWPLKATFGPNVFQDWAGLYGPMLQFTLIGLVFWTMCYVLYRFGLFLRI